MADPHEPDHGAITASARAIFDRGAIGMCVLSLEGDHLHTNPAFCDMVDRTEEELKALRWTDLVDPESLARAGDWWAALERDSRWRGELRVTRPDGSLVPALCIISLVRDEEGKPAYLFKQTIDLTQSLGLKESLRGAAAVTDSVLAALNLLGEGVMIVDPSTILPLYVNEAITKIGGYTAQELQTMPGGLLSILEPEQAEAIQDRLARRRRGEDVPSNFEFEFLRKGGSRVCVETTGQLVPGDPDLLFLIVRDITQRKAFEAHLHRAGRVDAMGRLAAGTAHDFNNLLTSILGEADLLLDSLQDAANPNWGEIREGVQDIRETAELGARLAKQLLNMGSSRGLTAALVDVTEVIEKMEHVLVRAIADGAVLETNLCADECLAQMFPGELEQVVLNLVLNASDALPDGGTIRIETSRRRVSGTEDLIAVVVSDDGPGIAPEVVARMFEPFFTTKAGGRGAGLGLSVVDAIVTRTKGTVVVDSDLGRGTTVKVLLSAANR